MIDQKLMARSSSQCHGCGSILKNSLLYYPINGKLHKGFCQECSCWSYFDQDGNYKDPPLTDVLKESETILNSKNSMRLQDFFCDECTRNQTIVMQIMANYLPDEQDSDYDILLKNSKKYKKELESRYPLVCSKCAPNVERKLLKVNKRLWSMVKANTDPKTISASKQLISLQSVVLGLGLMVGVALFFDWIWLSKRVSDGIIIGLVILLLFSQRGKKTEKVYPPTSIKVHGNSIGTQCDSMELGDSETNVLSDQGFSLNSLSLSRENVKSKSGIFSSDVGEPVRVPWHVSSFQLAKTDINPTHVRLDSNPQMINPKSWAKTAFMPNQQAKTRNTIFNLGPDLIAKDSRTFELKKPTFVPPSEMTGLEDLISSSFHIQEKQSVSKGYMVVIMLVLTVILIFWIARFST